jgi:hypothetical protein
MIDNLEGCTVGRRGSTYKTRTSGLSGAISASRKGLIFRAMFRIGDDKEN